MDVADVVVLGFAFVDSSLADGTSGNLGVRAPARRASAEMASALSGTSVSNDFFSGSYF